MTEEEARELIRGLTEEEKIILREMLSCPEQNPLPFERPSSEDSPGD